LKAVPRSTNGRYIKTTLFFIANWTLGKHDFGVPSVKTKHGNEMKCIVFIKHPIDDSVQVPRLHRDCLPNLLPHSRFAAVRVAG
jgi:hypothetical protein